MTVVPNAFQVFNFYVDRALALLDNDEVRIIIFATRHIMGWQDKISKRKGVISISMFEKGFTDSKGNIYGGTGLRRKQIVDGCERLVQFGFFEKVGEPTPDGQEWMLSDGDIRWDLLEARKAEKTAANRKRTLKASAGYKAKHPKPSSSHEPLTSSPDEPLPPSSSHEPAEVRPTNQPSAEGSSSHERNQSHLQSHLQSQDDSTLREPMKSAVEEVLTKDTEPSPLARPPKSELPEHYQKMQRQNRSVHPLVKAYQAAFAKPPRGVNAIPGVYELAEELATDGYTPEQVTACVKSKLEGRTTEYRFLYLGSDLPEWVRMQEVEKQTAAQTNQPTRTMSPAKPEPPRKPMSKEEIAQMRAAGAGVQTV